jgi:uncharacterized protein (DUF302 family)
MTMARLPTEQQLKTIADSGVITVASRLGPAETGARLEAAVTARGMTVFAVIDHAAGAAEVGLALRPTRLFVFGSAKAGTKLMQAVQMTGLDLPLKVLIWQDEAGATWLSYNDPRWIARRHGAAEGQSGSVDAMASVLAEVASEATGVQ